MKDVFPRTIYVEDTHESKHRHNVLTENEASIMEDGTVIAKYVLGEVLVIKETRNKSMEPALLSHFEVQE